MTQLNLRSLKSDTRTHKLQRNCLYSFLQARVLRHFYANTFDVLFFIVIHSCVQRFCPMLLLFLKHVSLCCHCKFRIVLIAYDDFNVDFSTLLRLSLLFFLIRTVLHLFESSFSTEQVVVSWCGELSAVCYVECREIDIDLKSKTRKQIAIVK